MNSAARSLRSSAAPLAPARIVRDAQAVARRLLAEREAATYLGIGERTLRTWESLGRIRACRIGRTKRYDVRDLEDLVARAKTEGVD